MLSSLKDTMYIPVTLSEVGQHSLQSVFIRVLGMYRDLFEIEFVMFVSVGLM